MTRRCDYYLCAKPFEGRANKRYCSTNCRKTAEHARAKLKKLVERTWELARLEREELRRDIALSIRWEQIRRLRAKAERDRDEITILRYQLGIQKDHRLMAAQERSQHFPVTDKDGNLFYGWTERERDGFATAETHGRQSRSPLAGFLNW